MHSLHAQNLAELELLSHEVCLKLAENKFHGDKDNDNDAQNNVHEVVVHEELVLQADLPHCPGYWVNPIILITLKSIMPVRKPLINKINT